MCSTENAEPTGQALKSCDAVRCTEQGASPRPCWLRFFDHDKSPLFEAILDMEDHGFGEGLGPETHARAEAWKDLVEVAEKHTGRKALANMPRQTVEKGNQWVEDVMWGTKTETEVEPE